MMADVDCGRALGITDHSADVGAAEAGPVRQTSRIITLLPHHHHHHHHHHHLYHQCQVDQGYHHPAPLVVNLLCYAVVIII